MVRILFSLIFAALGIAQPVLHLKTRPIAPPGSRLSEIRSPLVTGRGHLIVQFEATPGPDTIAALQQRGVRILADVPENGLIVSLDRNADVSDLGMRFASPLAPEDKVSPLTVAGFNIVELHPDADPNEVRAFISSLSLNLDIELRQNPDLRPNHLLVKAGDLAIAELARNDSVAYVFPASDALANGTPSVACGGAMTVNGGAVQSIPTFGDGWAGPGHGSAVVGYVFSKITEKLDPTAAQAEILRAMAEWSKAVKVTWQPGSSATAPKTVNILFASGDHGDGYPFDGPGGVLAHTFYPAPPNPEPIAGDMHFDDSEAWHIGANTDLFSVALHELGHALGLGHADSPTAVMYPYYKMATGLSALDISTVQTLYAAQTANPPAPPNPTNPVTPNPPAPAPLTLTVNPPASTTTATAVAISGTTSGGSGTVTVAWSTDHGQSGIAQGSSSWTISAIGLTAGPNTITITAFDSSSRVTQAYVVTENVAGPPTPVTPSGPKGTNSTPPSLTVVSPGATTISTSAASITFSGTASDNTAVASVTWSTNTGNSGTASGTTQWSATIPLLVGSNTITIRATDPAGNVAWRSAVVTRY